jgi:golgi pH regulator
MPSSLISLVILSVSQAGFYLLGNHVLNHYIISKDSVERQDPIIKGVYFISFCVSLTVLELLGCEILDLFPRSLRSFFWELCLIILLILLILIVPFFQFQIMFFNRSKSPFPKLLIAIFIIYCWCFYKIGTIFPIIDQSVPTSLFSVQQGISRIGILGITLLALISGYGSVAGPATYIFVKKVSYEHLESAEKSYKHSEKLLEDKKEQFQRFCEQRISDKPDNSTFNWFLKRVSTAINMNSSDQDSKNNIFN